MIKISWFFFLIFLFLVNVSVLANAQSSLFAGGDGSPANPFQITNWHHLNEVRNRLTSHFILMNNLDETTFGYTEVASSTANAGAGWQPIGTEIAVQFTGNFNGQGHEIRGLFINSLEWNVGFFGAVGNVGIIKNVGVVNGNVTGHSLVGGLVGRNFGHISNSYFTGSVMGMGNEVGGLVGRNYDVGTIANSYFTGSVAGEIGTVGGLVGVNHGTVNNSYSTGSVSGRDNNVGGLVGFNAGNVNNSYSTGSVVGGRRYGGRLGGLVGLNAGTVINSFSTGSVTGTGGEAGGLVGVNGGTVTNSFSTGSVTGTSRLGGLIGISDAGVTVTNSFWNTETSGQTISAGGTGMTTVEMRALATFSGITPSWDVVAVANGGVRNTNHIWNIVDGVTYPLLSWQPVTTHTLTMAVSPAGGGTATDVTATSPYPAGTVVNIQAVTNPGFSFAGWTAPAGTFGSPTAATTTFTMPAQDVTVTAQWEVVTEIQRVPEFSVKLGPNPIRESLVITISDAGDYVGRVVRLSVYDSRGRAFRREEIVINGVYGEVEVDVSQLPAGVCFVVLEVEGFDAKRVTFAKVDG